MPSTFAHLETYHDLTVYPGSFQTGYSVVAACVLSLRWKEKTSSQISSSSWREGVICLFMVALGGFISGLYYRVNISIVFLLLALVVAVLACIALYFRQVRDDLYSLVTPFTACNLHLLPLLGSKLVSLVAGGNQSVDQPLYVTSCTVFPQVYADTPGFSCPGVPLVPAVCIFFNMFLFAQVGWILEFALNQYIIR